MTEGADCSFAVISWRTLTNTSGPVRPDFSVTSAIVDTRQIRSPTRSGCANSNWLPAHMRRGRGTGGRKPPRFAWPSGPTSDWRYSGRKYSQCQSGGNGVPAAGRSAARSSVADSAAYGVAVTMSSTVSVLPIQRSRSALVVAVISKTLLQVADQIDLAVTGSL